MPKFEIRVGMRPRIVIPGFSENQMRSFGEFAIVEMEEPNSQAINVLGQPARPLSERYRKYKAGRGLRPVRDMQKTGALHKAIQVTESSGSRVKVDIVGAGEQRKGYINQNLDPWFGLSHENEESLLGNIQSVFGDNVRKVNER